jgi:hypothetical protein
LADLKQDMALCANLMNMIDRRATEHEASQRDQGMIRHGAGERAEEESRPEQGDEGTAQR